MNESFPGRGPELEPPAPIFGDIIVAKNFNYERPSIVVELTGNDMVHAIGIIDEPQNRYGMPGTVAVKDVIRTVGHKNFEEVVDAYTAAMSDIPLPYADLRAKIHQRLTQQLSTFPKSD